MGPFWDLSQIWIFSLGSGTSSRVSGGALIAITVWSSRDLRMRKQGHVVWSAWLQHHVMCDACSSTLCAFDILATGANVGTNEKSFTE